MEIKVLKSMTLFDLPDALRVVSGILNIVDSIFVPEMKSVYKDERFFLEQVMNPKNISICCYTREGELTGYLLAMPQNDKIEELRKHDPEFEDDPDDIAYYVEIIMSHSAHNHESKRSSFMMINELIREADWRGKRYITMHALRNEGLSYVIMTLYPAQLVRERVVMPELYGPDEEFDYLVADIWEYKKRHKKKVAA